MALDRSAREKLIQQYADGPVRLRAALATVPQEALRWRPRASGRSFAENQTATSSIWRQVNCRAPVAWSSAVRRSTWRLVGAPGSVVGAEMTAQSRCLDRFAASPTQ
jgi:hypothetical protein